MANGINGSAMLLLIEGTAVAFGKSLNFNLSKATIDVSNKDSASNKEIISGQKSGSFDFDGIYVDNPTYGYEDIFALWQGTATATIRIAMSTTGTKYYEAEAIVTNLTLTAPMEDAITFSCTLEISGAVTQGTVA